MGSGLSTIPGPPPYGLSSTVRWGSEVCTRGSSVPTLNRPRSTARPTMPNFSAPLIIPGNSVTTWMFTTGTPTRAPAANPPGSVRRPPRPCADTQESQAPSAPALHHLSPPSPDPWVRQQTAQRCRDGHPEGSVPPVRPGPRDSIGAFPAGASQHAAPRSRHLSKRTRRRDPQLPPTAPPSDHPGGAPRPIYALCAHPSQHAVPIVDTRVAHRVDRYKSQHASSP